MEIAAIRMVWTAASCTWVVDYRGRRMATRRQLLEAAAGLVDDPTLGDGQLARGVVDVMMLAAGKVPMDLQQLAIHDPATVMDLMRSMRELMAQQGNKDSTEED